MPDFMTWDSTRPFVSSVLTDQADKAALMPSAEFPEVYSTRYIEYCHEQLKNGRATVMVGEEAWMQT